RENRALGRALARLAPGPVGFLGTGPVFFTRKPPTENSILMAGDAAGVIDPFSGEGQGGAAPGRIPARRTARAESWQATRPSDSSRASSRGRNARTPMRPRGRAASRAGSRGAPLSGDS